MRRAALFASFILLAACSTNPDRVERAAIEPPDCKAWIGFDRDGEYPGYWIDGPKGRTCVPMLVTATPQPADYRGDFRVEDFTDAKLKARWAACKADPACSAKVEPPSGLAPMSE